MRTATPTEAAPPLLKMGLNSPSLFTRIVANDLEHRRKHVPTSEKTPASVVISSCFHAAKHHQKMKLHEW
ncbi:hypothetical protein U9M48_029833 [Paspalum notatum var. saurae]|uniref:Uncharacterized protein n=1 Tax=Paspalum notatum var. saurae TaxID=547442 RepID=A0AAQ3U2D9_PASNO